MNARPIRNRPLSPVLTLGAALVTGVSALLTAGVNAEGVPTPSETTFVAVTPTAAAASIQTASNVTTTPPTGTMVLVAP